MSGSDEPVMGNEALTENKEKSNDEKGQEFIKLKVMGQVSLESFSFRL